MQKYINYEGTIFRGDIVSIPDYYKSLETSYYVYVFNHDDRQMGKEHFKQYPSEDQIVFSICKYGGIKAEVKVVYEMNFDF